MKPKNNWFQGVVSALVLFALSACGGDLDDVAPMTVDFDWQQIDKGSQENPEIRLAGVPAETTRFLVSLVDLNLKGFDHGSGFAANDGSGTIARGAVRGSYNGPDPPFPSVKHTYEITVTAYDAEGRIVGVGRQAKVFVYADER